MMKIISVNEGGYSKKGLKCLRSSTPFILLIQGWKAKAFRFCCPVFSGYSQNIEDDKNVKFPNLKFIFAFVIIFPIMKLIVGSGGTNMKINLYVEDWDSEEIRLKFYNR